MEDKEEVEKMTEKDKADILEKSRNENKDGDERDKRLSDRCMGVAFSVALGLAIVVEIVLSCLGKSSATELWMVLMGGGGVGYTMLGIFKVKKRKLFLTVGIIAIALFVLFLTLWILELCGVA